MFVKDPDFACCSCKYSALIDTTYQTPTSLRDGNYKTVRIRSCRILSERQQDMFLSIRSS